MVIMKTKNTLFLIRLLLALLSACSVQPAWSQTAVQFCTDQLTGAQLSNPITIKPTINPLFATNHIIYAGLTIKLATVAGCGTTNLMPGYYDCVIQGVGSTFTILVPATNTTIQAADWIVAPTNVVFASYSFQALATNAPGTAGQVYTTDGQGSGYFANGGSGSGVNVAATGNLTASTNGGANVVTMDVKSNPTFYAANGQPMLTLGNSGITNGQGTASGPWATNFVFNLGPGVAAENGIFFNSLASGSPSNNFAIFRPSLVSMNSQAFYWTNSGGGKGMSWIVGNLLNPGGDFGGVNFTATGQFNGNGVGVTNVPLASLQTNGAAVGNYLGFIPGQGWVATNAPASGSGVAVNTTNGSGILLVTNAGVIQVSAQTNLTDLAGTAAAVGASVSNGVISAALLKASNLSDVSSFGLGLSNLTHGAISNSGNSVVVVNTNFVDSATNTGAFTVGNTYDTTAMMNVNGTVQVNFPPQVYGGAGYLSVDGASARRFAAFTQNGQYAKWGHATGSPFTIAGVGLSDFANLDNSTTFTNQLVIDANGQVTFPVSSNQTIQAMSPANGPGNYLTDMFTSVAQVEGTLGWTKQNTVNNVGLWAAGAVGTGTNTWGRPIDIFGGMNNIGNPYWYDIPRQAHGNTYLSKNYGPTLSTIGYAFANGTTNSLTGQDYWQLKQANPWSGISMMLFAVGMTNSIHGTLIGTNADGVKIYMPQFGLQVGEISDAYRPLIIPTNPALTELIGLSQQYNSEQILWNDLTRNLYFTVNTGRAGDTLAVSQAPMFILSPTNLNAGYQRGLPSWQGFPLVVKDVYTPMQTNYLWGFAADLNSGDIQHSNGWDYGSNFVSVAGGKYYGNGSTLTNILEAGLTLADNTTNNATTSAHGFAPKLDGNTAHYLNGNGAWTTPAGGGGSTPTFSAQFSSDGVNTNITTGVNITNLNAWSSNAPSITEYGGSFSTNTATGAWSRRTNGIITAGTTGPVTNIVVNGVTGGITGNIITVGTFTNGSLTTPGILTNDANGKMYSSAGALPLARVAAPTGSGYAHVTSGAWDTASSTPTRSGVLCGVGGTSSTPANSTSYYFGWAYPANWASCTTEGKYDIVLPETGTIIAYSVHLNGTGGDSTSCTFLLDYNSGTTFGSSSQTMTGFPKNFVVTGLSQAVTAGNGIALKLTTGAFGSAPTACTLNWTVVYTVP